MWHFAHSLLFNNVYLFIILYISVKFYELIYVIFYIFSSFI